MERQFDRHRGAVHTTYKRGDSVLAKTYRNAEEEWTHAYTKRVKNRQIRSLIYMHTKTVVQPQPKTVCANAVYLAIWFWDRGRLHRGTLAVTVPYGASVRQGCTLKIVSFSCNTLSVSSCHATRRKHEGWNTARLPKPRQRKSRGRDPNSGAHWQQSTLKESRSSSGCGLWENEKAHRTQAASVLRDLNRIFNHWPIVTTALAENRHELVLAGPDIAKLITDTGLDDRIYALERLNFLEISQTGLDSLSEKLGNLKQLAQLGLTSNRLTRLPDAVGRLKCLRFLDVSFNQLSELPEKIFTQLDSLTSLNLSGNELEKIPEVGKLLSLQELRSSKNRLQSLPDGIHLLQSLILLDVSHNKLTSVPDEMNGLKNLKSADFSDNSLASVPATLHQCRKLHDLRLQNNPLKDNRLRKLACDTHSPKALFDYLRRLDEAGGKGKKGRGKAPPTKDIEPTEADTRDAEPTESVPVPPYISVQRPDESEHYQISQSSSVKNGPRPYLIACTVHGVVFKSEAHLKSFTRAQEEWHRGMGQMRRRATLATHDLKAVQFPLTYSMQKAEEIEIHVLNDNAPTTGDKFLSKLYQEAEADRKTRKQAKFSQLYRYLNLLSLEPNDVKDGCRDNLIPIVKDASQTVISMPPLTNCQQTRLDVTTTDLLVEVSGASLAFCKELAEAVIAWLLENACSPNQRESSTLSTIPANCLVVRPVRVIDSESTSQLSSIYPSRLDLTAPNFNTVR
ncbi:leucine-rich repeat-containing protein 47 [Clonorchis sinensis]|uniref:Leucine-rich repeat-containing protein 47 n=1 Tax=Clonorchis sinensis TaxID=79923 RepID=G7YL73_CLOSI|nr:leucine-rich repeat-containing protein 47 [Clonorchis sinensis]